jgi:hypothetical protein
MAERKTPNDETRNVHKIMGRSVHRRLTKVLGVQVSSMQTGFGSELLKSVKKNFQEFSFGMELVET